MIYPYFYDMIIKNMERNLVMYCPRCQNDLPDGVDTCPV